MNNLFFYYPNALRVIFINLLLEKCQTLVLNKELTALFDVILKEVVEELEKEDSENLQ